MLLQIQNTSESTATSPTTLPPPTTFQITTKPTTRETTKRSTNRQSRGSLPTTLERETTSARMLKATKVSLPSPPPSTTTSTTKSTTTTSTTKSTTTPSTTTPPATKATSKSKGITVIAKAFSKQNILMSFLFFVLFSITTATSNSEVYYISNMTSILFINHSQSETLYHNPRGMISSLALDVEGDRLMFWSDVSPPYKGIYFAHLSNLDLDQKLDLRPRPEKVLALAIDPVHNNLYWTDEVQSTVEVYSYVTKVRRTLVFVDLKTPRGIALDLQNGFLYWNDQGLNRVERSRLDGSERTAIVTTKYPNHMVVHKRRLFWLNSDTKQLLSVDWDGSNMQTVADFSGLINKEHIFGLTIDTAAKSFIVSTSSRRSRVFAVSMETNVIEAIENDLGSYLYGLASENAVQTPTTANACSSLTFNGRICTTIDTRAILLCPSYGGLVQVGDQCRVPTSVLLFTILDYGYIAYVNDPKVSQNGIKVHKDVQFVYKMQRPAAITYDPLLQMVYWSDVHPYGVYRCPLNCTNPFRLLDRQDGIGRVEGMFFNPNNRMLVFSDVGEVVKEDGGVFGWNRIQLLNVENKALWTVLDAGGDAKLRAVYSDGRNVTYTDWGQSGRIGSVFLSGRKENVIKSGLDNPNGFFVDNTFIYFIDSHYKHNNNKNNNNNNNDKKAGLYRMTKDGRILNIFDIGQKIPFGITLDKSRVEKVYMSDWQHGQVVAFDYDQVRYGYVGSTASPPMQTLIPRVEPPPPPDGIPLHTRVVISGVPSIFNLLFTRTFIKPPQGQDCPSCEGVCVTGVCRCPSLLKYNSKTLSQCPIPKNFILFSDLTSIKLLNLDPNVRGTAQNMVTTIVYSNMYNTDLNALTYDETSYLVYFFNHAMIMGYSLKTNARPFKVYSINHHIESMTLYKDYLVWVDSVNGLLCSLPTTTSSNNTLKHTILLSGLSNPHSVRYYNGHLYWSESGQRWTVSRLRADAMTSASSAQREVVMKGKVGGEDLWPGVVFLDWMQNRMMLTNGPNNQLFDCSVNGTGCTDKAVNLGKIGDFYYAKNMVIYTDLSDNSLKAVPLTVNPSMPTMLLSNLVRPGKLFVKNDWNISQTCRNCYPGKCKTFIGGLSYCICPANYYYDQKLQQCIDSTNQDYTCLYNGKMQNFSSVVQPNPCATCQCQGTSITYGDSDSLKGFVCSQSKCPDLNCPVEKRVRGSGECCGRCVCDSIRFTSCPQIMVEIPLPPFANYVIDTFKPKLKDCLDIPRNLHVTRSPVNNIIQWKEGVSPADQLSDVTFIGQVEDSNKVNVIDKAQCSYKVKLKDITKPMITCPRDVTVFTFGEEVEEVRWNPARTSDKVGIKKMSSEPAWGSRFNLGVTKVFYEVKDDSDLTSYCTCNVNIVKVPVLDQGGNDPTSGTLKLEGEEEDEDEDGLVKRDVSFSSQRTPSFNVRKCLIKILLNGYLNCSVVQEDNNGNRKDVVRCEVVCDDDYEDEEAFPSSYKCSSGPWTPNFPENVENFQCRKIKHKTLTGILPLDLTDKCQPHHDIDHDYTRLHLLYSVTQRIRDHGVNSLKFSTTTDGCEDARRRRKRSVQDLTYEIGIGKETPAVEKEDEKVRLSGLLNDSSNLINENFIPVITKSESQGLQNEFDYSFKEAYFLYSCEEGEVPAGELCLVCPVGFFKVDGDCSICPSDTFNAREGAVSCITCPNAATSPPGSISKLQCLSRVAESTSCGYKCTLGLAIGIPLFVILLLIILLIVLCCCCIRNRSRSAASNIHLNDVYEEPNMRNGNGKVDGADDDAERRLHFLSEEDSTHAKNGPNGTVNTNPAF